MKHLNFAEEKGEKQSFCTGMVYGFRRRTKELFPNFLESLFLILLNADGRSKCNSEIFSVRPQLRLQSLKEDI